MATARSNVNGARRSGGEVQNLLADVEDLLGRITNINDADIAAVRERVTDSIDKARDSLKSGVGKIQDRAVSAAGAADAYAHDNPWPLIGIAAAAGVVVGMLVARR
jgi:ElaB/YqjD/DUF883 family membrane-anchored ribosome-binding protein